MGLARILTTAREDFDGTGIEDPSRLLCTLTKLEVLYFADIMRSGQLL